MEKEPAGEKVKIITSTDEYTFNGAVQIPSRRATLGVVYESNGEEENVQKYDISLDVPDGVEIAVEEYETEDDGTAVDCISTTDNGNRCTITAQEGSNLCHIHNKELDEESDESESDNTDNTDEEYKISFTGSFDSKRVIGIVSEGKASFKDNDFEYHTYGRVTDEFYKMIEQRYEPEGNSTSSNFSGFN